MADGTPIFLGFFLPGLLIVTANTVIFIFTVKEIHDTLKSAPNSDKQEKSREMKVLTKKNERKRNKCTKRTKRIKPSEAEIKKEIN